MKINIWCFPGFFLVYLHVKFCSCGTLSITSSFFINRHIYFLMFSSISLNMPTLKLHLIHEKMHILSNAQRLNLDFTYFVRAQNRFCVVSVVYCKVLHFEKFLSTEQTTLILLHSLKPNSD